MEKKRYALFVLLLFLVTGNGWGREVCDTLTRVGLGLKGEIGFGNAYVQFSGKVFHSSATYNGFAAPGGASRSIQLSKTKQAGIFTAASGGKLKSVSITTIPTSISKVSINVYASNTPYSSLSDELYDPKGKKCGKLLGTASFSSDHLTSTISANGDYTYLGIRPADDSNANYLEKIVVVWEVDDPLELAVSTAGYATLYNGQSALQVPAGATAYTFKVSHGELVVSKTYEAGTVLPAGEAVVVKANPGKYFFETAETVEEKDADNVLFGTDQDEVLPADAGARYYMLSLNSDKTSESVGFYWGADDGGAFTNTAHHAYLKLGKAQTAKAAYVLNHVVTSLAGPMVNAGGMESSSTATFNAKAFRYNLHGVRVGSSYRGIVVQNGRKFIVR